MIEELKNWWNEEKMDVLSGTAVLLFYTGLARVFDLRIGDIPNFVGWAFLMLGIILGMYHVTLKKQKKKEEVVEGDEY